MHACDMVTTLSAYLVYGLCVTRSGVIYYYGNEKFEVLLDSTLLRITNTERYKSKEVDCLKRPLCHCLLRLALWYLHKLDPSIEVHEYI